MFNAKWVLNQFKDIRFYIICIANNTQKKKNLFFLFINNKADKFLIIIIRNQSMYRLLYIFPLHLLTRDLTQLNSA